MDPLKYYTNIEELLDTEFVSTFSIEEQMREVDEYYAYLYDLIPEYIQMQYFNNDIYNFFSLLGAVEDHDYFTIEECIENEQWKDFVAFVHPILQELNKGVTRGTFDEVFIEFVNTIKSPKTPITSLTFSDLMFVYCKHKKDLELFYESESLQFHFTLTSERKKIHIFKKIN